MVSEKSDYLCIRLKEKCISQSFKREKWASLLRPAPSESPQDGNVARVRGCSGAIRIACPPSFFKNPTFCSKTFLYSPLYYVQITDQH